MGKSVLIDNFSGGMKRESAKLSDTQSSNLLGLSHLGGDLHTIDGVSGIGEFAYSTYPTGLGTPQSHSSYGSQTSKITYCLKRMDQTVWVGIPQSTYLRDFTSSGANPILMTPLAHWEMSDNGPNEFDRILGVVDNRDFLPYNCPIAYLWSTRVHEFFGLHSGLYCRDYTELDYDETQSFAISMWVKSDEALASGSDPRRLIGHINPTSTASGWKLNIGDSSNPTTYGGKLVYTAYGPSATNSYMIAANAAIDWTTWHHVVVVHDNHGAPSAPDNYIYIDGVAVANTVTVGGSHVALDVANDHTDSWNTCWIGAASSTTFGVAYGSNAFKGKIGAVTLYRCANTDIGTMKITAAQALQQYTAEKYRYLGPAVVSYDYVPLLGNSLYCQDTAITPISSRTLRGNTFIRSSAEVEHFVQIGSNLYFGTDEPSTHDYLYRWSGPTSGLARVDATLTLDNTHTYYTIGGVHAKWRARFYINVGWMVFFKVGGKWETTGHVIWQIDRDNFRVYLEDEGPLDHTVYDVAFVNVHRAGVDPGTTCAAIESNAGNTLPEGTYYYKWRYVNSNTGYVGEFSSTGTCTLGAGEDTATISGWDVNPPTQDITGLEIYRSSTGANGLYYLVQEASTKTYTPATNIYERTMLASSYVDTGWLDATLGNVIEEVDSGTFVRPQNLGKLKYYGNRLYGATQDYLWFSNMDEPEYMPGFYNGALTGEDYTSSIYGGYMPIGLHGGDWIQTIHSESGTYNTQGLETDNLMIFTRSRVIRWYGSNWSNFVVKEAFNTGVLAHKTVASNGSVTVWLASSGHVMVVPQGGTLPTIASGAIFPNGVMHSRYTTDSTRDDTWDNWCGTIWGDYYLLSGSLTADHVNDTTWMLHLPTMTWTSIPYGYNDFHQWDPVGALNFHSLTGTNAYPGDVEHIHTLFYGPPSGLSAYASHMDCEWVSRPISLPSSPRDVPRKCRVDRLRICCSCPTTADTTLAVKVIGSHNTAVEYTGSETIAHDHTNPGSRTIVETRVPTCKMHPYFQIKLTWNAVEHMQIDWVEVELVDNAS